MEHITRGEERGKPKLLIVCDAVAPTGWARVGHALANRLQEYFIIDWLGINYFGDPHTFPYRIYPAFLGGDHLGVQRFRAIANHVQPDVTLIIQDVWVLDHYLQHQRPGERYVCYPPVDAINQVHAGDLDNADLCVFYTQFGLDTCRRDGFFGEAAIVPHGIDRRVFFPRDKVQARLSLGLSPEDAETAIIVGAVNRNQPRKRLDVTLEAMALALDRWPKTSPKLYLLMHTNAKDRIGYDLMQLSRYYGLDGHMLWPVIGDKGPLNGVPAPVLTDEQLAMLYSAMDMQVSTSVAEGWGLTHAEGMACGVPQILPEHSALAEWARPAAYYVPATCPVITPGQVNTIGMASETSAVAEALLLLAGTPTVRERLRQAGLDLMAEPRFSWDVIAEQFRMLLMGVIAGTVPDDLLAPEVREMAYAR